MLEAIQSLANLLSKDPLSVEEVINNVGTVTHDYGSNVMLKPHDPLFKLANVVRKIDLDTLKSSDTPAHVDLTPFNPPAVDTLAEMFGNYDEIEAEEKVPHKIIFYIDEPSKPFTVALLGEVKQGHITKITLRRDIRL